MQRSLARTLNRGSGVFPATRPGIAPQSARSTPGELRLRSDFLALSGQGVFGLLVLSLCLFPGFMASGATNTTALAVNSGGVAIGRFAADNGYSGGASAGSMALINTNGLTSPAPQSVYQTERSGSFSYVFTGLVPAQTYKLRLHFSENKYTAAGQRLFNVSVNGAAILTSFDIVAAAGTTNKAVIREFQAVATTGQLVLQYTSVLNGAKSSAIEVVPRTLAVASLPSASGLTYGQPFSASILNGGSVTNVFGDSVPGSFGFAASTAIPSAGTTNAAVIFTPADTASYSSLTAAVSVAVSKQSPGIAALPAAPERIYGQPLGDAPLTGGSVTNASGVAVQGHFNFADPGLFPPAGNTNLLVTFTPDDASNYIPVSDFLAVAVAKQTPAVAVPIIASPLTYGQSYRASSLSGGMVTNSAGAVVPGTFAFSSPDTVPAVGDAAPLLTFTPEDTANYNSVQTTASANAFLLAYEVGSPTRNNGVISYRYNNAASLGNLPFQRVRYRMEAEVNGTPAFTETTFDVWPGLTVLQLAVPDSSYQGVLQTNVSNLTVNSSAEGVLNATAQTGRLEISAGDYSPMSNGAGGSSAAYDFDDTLSPGYGYGSFQIHNLSANPPQTVVAWNNHDSSYPDVGFGNNPDGEPDWTFNGPMLGLDLATWKLQISIEAGSPALVNPATPVVAAPPAASAIIYGQPLSASLLTGGALTNAAGTRIPGTFQFNEPAALLDPGTQTAGVTFTPSDEVNYTKVPLAVSVFIGLQTPSVALFPTASPVIFGQPLSASTLTGGVVTNAAGAAVAGQYRFDHLSDQPYAGTTNAAVTFTPADTNRYTVVSLSVPVSVGLQTAVVAVVPTASAITFGQTLSASVIGADGVVTNAAGQPLSGVFTFVSPAATPYAGLTNAAATFAPADAANYTEVTLSVPVSVGSQTAVVAVAPTASSITFGQALAASSLSGGVVTNAAGVAVPGQYRFDHPTDLPYAGITNVSVTFTPADAADYTEVSLSVPVSVGLQTAVVAVVPAASPITFGQALSASSLSGGVVTNAAGVAVAGQYSFDHPTDLPYAGITNAAVTFTPADTANYTAVALNVPVSVGLQTAVVAVVPTASSLSYGQMFSSATLTGGSATNAAGTIVPGSFSFASPSGVPNAGTTNAAVLFTPSDTADYSAFFLAVAVTVSRQTPEPVRLPSASSLVYGQTLSTSILTGGAATNRAGAPVQGLFGFTSPNLMPYAGTTNVGVAFTPTDSNNYASFTRTVSVSVNRQSPLVSVAPAAGSITYGQALSASALSGGVVTNMAGVVVPGNFAFVSPSNQPSTGLLSVSVLFTPADTNNYTSLTTTAGVQVNPVSVSVATLPTASRIDFGQSLSNSILTGGSGSMPGSFAFTSPSTVPPAGTNLQSVTFTPADATNYSALTLQVSVPVNGAPVLSAISINGTEDTVLSLTAQSFTNSYSDPDGTPLDSIRVKSLPASGVLKWNGVSVSVDQIISAASLGLLTYSPATNEYGAKTFTVTASDGSTLSSAPATVSLNLAAVNDAPVASGTATLADVVEDIGTAAPGDTVSNLFSGNFSDAADAPAPNSLVGVFVSSYSVDATKGDWQYSTNRVNWISLPGASLSAGIALSAADWLRFVPATNYNGSATALSVNLIESGGASVVSGSLVNGSGAGPQLVLSTTNVIGQSSVYSGSFTADKILDEQTSSIGNEGFASGYWLGAGGSAKGYVLIDLGSSTLISKLEIYNTHNSGYNDRGTLNFHIETGNSVSGGALLGGVTNLSGTLQRGADPLFKETFNMNVGSASYRYLSFVCDSSVNNNPGLHEIRLFLMGAPAVGLATVYSAGSVTLQHTITPVPDAPSLATPSAVTYTDTPATDTFAVSSGTLQATDPDAGPVFTFGIPGVTPNGTTASLAGSYGTLALNTASGAWTFTPDNAAINALATNLVLNYTVTVTDGLFTTPATLTINLSGVRETPTITANPVASAIQADQPLSASCCPEGSRACRAPSLSPSPLSLRQKQPPTRQWFSCLLTSPLTTPSPPASASQ